MGVFMLYLTICNVPMYRCNPIPFRNAGFFYETCLIYQHILIPANNAQGIPVVSVYSHKWPSLKCVTSTKKANSPYS